MELGNFAFGNSRGEILVDRSWQRDFCEFLYDCGFDGYGCVENDKLLQYQKQDKDLSYFENEIFIVRQYYWGEDEDTMEKPNFVYKPTGFEIQWYKYPLRDSYMNQNIDFEQLKEIMNKCIESLTA